jgi:hypothetical protein
MLRRKHTKTPRPRTRGKDTMTCREIAYESGLALETVYAAIRAGEIPYRKVGPRHIVSRIAYQNWLAGFGLGGRTA